MSKVSRQVAHFSYLGFGASAAFGFLLAGASSSARFAAILRFRGDSVEDTRRRCEACLLHSSELLHIDFKTSRRRTSVALSIDCDKAASRLCAVAIVLVVSRVGIDVLNGLPQTTRLSRLATKFQMPALVSSGGLCVFHVHTLYLSDVAYEQEVGEKQLLHRFLHESRE
jgi:hypothetical protein